MSLSFEELSVAWASLNNENAASFFGDLAAIAPCFRSHEGRECLFCSLRFPIHLTFCDCHTVGKWLFLSYLWKAFTQRNALVPGGFQIFNLTVTGRKVFNNVLFVNFFFNQLFVQWEHLSCPLSQHPGFIFPSKLFSLYSLCSFLF